MAVYPSNKGVGEPITILGLSGQYIVIAIAVLGFWFCLTLILSNLEIPVLVAVSVPVGGGVVSFNGILYLNKHFGRHGFTKWQTVRLLPAYIKHTTRVKNLVKTAKR